MAVLNFQMALKYIPCSRSMLQTMIKRGKLDGYFYKIGNRYYFNSKRLDEWKERGGTNADK